MTQGKYTQDWYIFRNPDPDKWDISKRPPPPPWRDFQNPERRTYFQFQLEDDEVAVVNAALFLRRPLLVTGPPGTGKSSLAYTIANELELGDVLRWPITSRSNLTEALYRYDAIGRLQAQRTAGDNEEVPIGRFLQLGPLGTAFADGNAKPRVLLIDEIDKSDIDLPNDLLNIFEEGQFEIPELARLYIEQDADGAAQVEPRIPIRKHGSREAVEVELGLVSCRNFPVIVMTSNGERELPAPFLRRCLRIDIPAPSADKLQQVVNAHFGVDIAKLTDDGQQAQLRVFIEKLAAELEKRRRDKNEYVASDQLLNAIYLRLHDKDGLHFDDIAQLFDLPRGAEERKVIEFVTQAISRMSQL